MNERGYISKKLLYIPFFLVVAVLIIMCVYSMVVAKAPFDIVFLAGIFFISLFNIFPFFILRLIYLKVPFAIASDKGAFYMAFVMGILLILIVAGDALISFFSEKPGIQFIPLEFLILPVYVFLLMLIVYFAYLIFKFVLLKFKKT